MKTNMRIMLLVVSAILVVMPNVWAQRIITGTVYSDGEPAAGITVEAHRGKSSMMTSFDGKYKIEADEKTKWIQFTFIDERKRLDISDKEGDHFDFAFSGELPSGDDEVDEGKVNLKTMEELMQAKDRDFMNELSLYTEFYKQDNYKAALPHWRKVYNNYPKSTSNIYIQGIKMFQSFIENSETPEEKNKNIQELMKIYDKRIKYYNEKGYNLGRKASDWLKYKLGEGSALEGEQLKEALKQGYEWVNESIELQENNTELPVLLLLMQTSSSLFKMGELPKETIAKNYNKSMEIINAVIGENKDEQRVANAKELTPYIEDIFGKSGAADCEALISIFEPQFREKGEDIEYVKSMLRRLRRAKCDESPLFSEATEKLYQLDPSAEAAFNMARRYVRRDDPARAKDYYKQAMEQETDNELLSTYYYEYAAFIFVKESALQEARDYLRKAIALNADYCEALMLMGDVYVAASRNYEGDDFEKSAVFWVAVDYFEKARRAGDDCDVDALQKITDYRKYFPNKEEAFMRTITEGQTYKVGGWINETTTVRF